MKKYNDGSKSITESAAEKTLLENLFNFYLEKYAKSSIEQIEQHFLNALAGLIERDELDKKSTQGFLEEMGIEGELPVKKAQSYSSSYSGRSTSSC